MSDSIDPTCRVHVIAVNSFANEHVALAHIFGHTAWELSSVHSIREAAVELFAPRLAVPPVVLCDEVLHDGTWKELLRITQGLPNPHNLIVTSADADDRLWAEVLSLGAYDVLQKPFRSRELFRSIGLAWAYRRKAQSLATAGVAVARAGAVA